MKPPVWKEEYVELIMNSRHYLGGEDFTRQDISKMIRSRYGHAPVMQRVVDIANEMVRDGLLHVVNPNGMHRYRRPAKRSLGRLGRQHTDEELGIEEAWRWHR